MPRFFPQGHWLYLYIHVWSLPVLSSGTAAPCPRLCGRKTSSGYLCEYSTWCYPVEGVWLSSWRQSSQSGGPPGVSGSQSGPPGPPGLSQAHPGFPVRPGPAERSRGSLLLRGSLQFGAAVCPVASELSVFGVVTVTCCPGGGRLPCSPQAELHAGRRSRGRSFPENGGRGTEKDLNPSRNRIKTRNLGLI